MKVRDIMRRVFTIDQKASVSDAVKLMSKNHTHALVVINSNKIVGIITEGEIFDNLDSMEEKVSSFMVKEVKTISDDEELSECAEIMNREGVKRLPVLKKDKLVGLVTATDLIAHSGELSEVFLFD